MTDKLNATLLALGYPVERLVYTGDADTYFVFYLIYGQPVAYADDDNTAINYIFGVDLYTKNNYTALLQQTIAALKAGGFTIQSIDQEIYESDTKYFHVPLTITVLEE